MALGLVIISLATGLTAAVFSVLLLGTGLLGGLLAYWAGGTMMLMLLVLRVLLLGRPAFDDVRGTAVCEQKPVPQCPGREPV